jgi:hypothetical protein
VRRLLRHGSTVARLTIAKSAALGKPKSEEVEGVARVLPKSETRRVYCGGLGGQAATVIGQLPQLLCDRSVCNSGA